MNKKSPKPIWNGAFSLFCDPGGIAYPYRKLFITSIEPRTANAVLGFSFPSLIKSRFEHAEK